VVESAPVTVRTIRWPVVTVLWRKGIRTGLEADGVAPAASVKEITRALLVVTAESPMFVGSEMEVASS
jgi:hypothetical protein